jgi:hypothetical protein
LDPVLVITSSTFFPTTPNLHLFLPLSQNRRMSYKPIERMLERVDRARNDSDTTLFYDLLHLGEMVTKTIAAGLIASVLDDRDRSRYQQMHRLVRASGIGEWVQSIDDVLIGPAARHLSAGIAPERTELTTKVGPGTWQHESVSELQACLLLIDPTAEPLPVKFELRRWFGLFTRVRNKSRGHGAIPMAKCAEAAPRLEAAIRLVTDNHSLFSRPWAYLYQNLSGKYRVSGISGDASAFQHMKSTAGQKLHLPNGVYIFADTPLRVELMDSDVDLSDFYYANGGFTGKKYEQLSYITGNRQATDASAFLSPPSELPQSETEGLSELDIQGGTFGNLPPAPDGYVERMELEGDLLNVLSDQRHPVVTLVGRGGIGKTSLALTVLRRIAETNQFALIAWFSARDIDLLPQGPKQVRPHVLSSADIAKEFVSLVAPEGRLEKTFNNTTYFERAVSTSPIGGPILFVFDNFETVKNPIDLYNWLNTLVRLPNKVLITTRHREFKGDYPVEVGGMTEPESHLLINATARQLGVGHLLTDAYREELYDESGGHPYVIKVLLGEVAKAGRIGKVERIVAAQEEILDALFERTYAGLSPAARRTFLTLCSWRSVVPQIALEAVLLRNANERIDPAAAVTELQQSSFVELIPGQENGEEFLSVPLTAAVFGRSKLAVSPMKGAIEADTQLLQAFGAAQQSDIRHGLAPRVDRLFRSLAARISSGAATLSEHLPMLEFLARRYPPAWLLLAALHDAIHRGSFRD